MRQLNLCHEPEALDGYMPRPANGKPPSAGAVPVARAFQWWPTGWGRTGLALYGRKLWGRR